MAEIVAALRVEESRYRDVEYALRRPVGGKLPSKELPYLGWMI
jgi:hypothetical protein